MDTRTTYETGIAAKLEQLPIPDMADSIWAGIDAQLNAGNPPPQNPAKKTPVAGRVLYCCIIVAIIVFIVYKSNRKNKVQDNNRPVPAATKPVATDTAATRDTIHLSPQKKNTNTIVAPLHKKDTVAILSIPAPRIIPDSLDNQVMPVAPPDTFATIKTGPAIPSFNPPYTPVQKKPRGVKGITNDDYRIQHSTKDSLKKGGT